MYNVVKPWREIYQELGSLRTILHVVHNATYQGP